jgi:SAM-dependent methyltransferase/acyl carrier protein
VCQALNLQPSELELNRNLSAYGLDSVMVLDINNALSQNFDDLSQTLFFEYSTVNALADYFVASHRQSLERLAGLANGNQFQASIHTAQTGGERGEPSPPQRQPEAQAESGRDLSLDEMIERYDLEVEPPVEPPVSQPPEPSPGKRGNGLSPFAGRRDHSPFHSFAPFAEPVAGFSLTKTLLYPQECREQLRHVAERQAELRRVLFYREDWSRVGRVIDLGCGIGSDMVALAEADPALQVAGLTISKGDSQVAEQLIANRNLQDRVQLFLEDNGSHAYRSGNGEYGVIFSIQTMHFVRSYKAKRALFGKLAAALREDGVILLADYLCLLPKPMHDAVLGTTVHTREQWAQLMADNNLRVEGAVDASREVINFLQDPLVEEVVAGLEPRQASEIRKIARQVESLEKGWLRFSLLRIVKCAAGEALYNDNLAALERCVDYAEARREMEAAASMPAYEDIIAKFPEFLRGDEMETA